MELIVGGSMLFSRCSQGRIYSLEFDGSWSALPPIPRQLREASSLVWSEVDDGHIVAAAQNSGLLLAGGDFLDYHSGANSAPSSGDGRGGLAGVAMWNGSTWSMGVKSRQAEAATTLAAGARGIRWGQVRAMKVGSTKKIHALPPSAPLMDRRSCSLVAAARAGDGVTIIEWRSADIARQSWTAGYYWPTVSRHGAVYDISVPTDDATLIGPALSWQHSPFGRHATASQAENAYASSGSESRDVAQRAAGLQIPSDEQAAQARAMNSYPQRRGKDLRPPLSSSSRNTLLGTLILLPLVFLIYHTFSPNATDASVLLRKGSHRRRRGAGLPHLAPFPLQALFRFKHKG